VFLYAFNEDSLLRLRMGGFFMYNLFFFLINLDVFALMALAGGTAFFLFTRWVRLSKILILCAAIVLVIVNGTPLPRFILQTLEDRFQGVPLPERVDGLILLGGTFSLDETEKRGFAVHNEATSRLYDFITLMRRYPQAKVLFSGNLLEARMTKVIMQEHGVAVDNIIFEGQSQNTRDNVHNLLKAAAVKPEENWVLVTSAFHMPRSIGLFRGQGWNVIPHSVDYHTSGQVKFTEGFFPYDHKNALAWAVAVKEIAGLVNNWREGLSLELFPKP